MTDEGKIILRSKPMLNRNIYCPGLRTYSIEPYIDGKYYSDSSSFICSCFIIAGFDIPWMNIYALRSSDLFETIPIKFENDKIKNIDSLKVADIILWYGGAAMVHSIKNNKVILQHQRENETPSIIELRDAEKLYFELPTIRRFKKFIK